MTSSHPSARAWTGGRSAGTACASCCGAYRTPRYPCRPYPVDTVNHAPSSVPGAHQPTPTQRRAGRTIATASKRPPQPKAQMEKHHRLRRDPSWSPHGCNICGQVRTLQPLRYSPRGAAHVDPTGSWRGGGAGRQAGHEGRGSHGGWVRVRFAPTSELSPELRSQPSEDGRRDMRRVEGPTPRAIALHVVTTGPPRAFPLVRVWLVVEPDPRLLPCISPPAEPLRRAARCVYHFPCLRNGRAPAEH